MWKWMPFLCFLKGIKKRLGKRLEETSSPKGPSELQQERWKISSVNYWSETRLPSSVCQEIACPLAPPWKCDEAAEAVSGFPGRYTMLHVPMFFLLMPSPAETEWGRGGGRWVGRERRIDRVQGGSETRCFPKLHSPTYASPLVSDPHTNLCFILPRFHIRILTECYLRDGCEVKAQVTFTKSTTAFNSFAHFPDFKVLILAHGIFL